MPIQNDVKLGSGAVVTRDVPANVIVAGNPAQVLDNVVKK
jgi:acetyltransferase-like isoleucine patch superfamily enzyme